VQTAWLKVETLSAAFGPFLELDAAELAAALGGDTPLFGERLEVVAKTVRRMQSLMRQAVAMHEATRV
jgi:hypothetical protein